MPPSPVQQMQHGSGIFAQILILKLFFCRDSREPRAARVRLNRYAVLPRTVAGGFERLCELFWFFLLRIPA